MRFAIWCPLFAYITMIHPPAFKPTHMRLASALALMAILDPRITILSTVKAAELSQSSHALADQNGGSPANDVRVETVPETNEVEEASPESQLRMSEQIDRFEIIAAPPFDVPLFENRPVQVTDFEDDENWYVQQASMLQPTPFLAPRVALTPEMGQTQAASGLSTAVFASGDVDRSLLRQAKLGTSGFGVDYVQGEEAVSNVSTDVGSLLGKSNRALGVSVQKRTPVINDPRVRSSRIGSLAASGSHWVPARTDLDTVLSKIDSRQVSDVVIIPGPYSSLYGPGFQFVDFELARAPRFENGYEMHGRSSLDFKSNGGQVFGQQSFLVGDESWGARGSYSHRRGNNYESGDGNDIPSSYESREFSFAYGEDLGDGRSIEFTLLRLDQTDLEFPGYVFDIDYLVTDGYTFEYVDENTTLSDRSETELWYNRTRFEGNAQNPAKRAQFPLLDRLAYVGTTDVDSMSTGYRQGWTWGGGSKETYQFTAGHDLRFIKQELNEISSGVSLGLPIPYTNRNSPIPDSFSVNPGLFAEYRETIAETWTFKTGARADYAQTDIVDDPQKLAGVGLGLFPAPYSNIVGTTDFQQDFYLWSLYGTLERQINKDLKGSINLGYAERPPTLTELYAAQPFMLLLQNGLNNVTGDPNLEHEKMLQFDVMLDYESDVISTGIRGFHSWAFDYVTFENTDVTTGPPNGDVQQVSLRSVNTDLATLAGFESFAELFPKNRLTPFVTVRYVDGRDRTRNGNFATQSGDDFTVSNKVRNLRRGFFSGILGADAEPLPGIAPLETRIGTRLRNDVKDERWNIELAARIVDNQDRVATSLLENPTAGFTVWDLRGTWRPLKKHDVTLVSGVENFTDKQYREHLDFRSLNGVSVFQPGANFYFGADVAY
jgi:iron complex outermembrane recepter protein